MKLRDHTEKAFAEVSLPDAGKEGINQGVKESGSQGVKESGNQGIRESENQGNRKNATRGSRLISPHPQPLSPQIRSPRKPSGSRLLPNLRGEGSH